MKRLLIGLGCVLLVAGLGVYVRRVIHETVLSHVAGQEYVVSLGDSVAAGAGLGDSSGRQPAGCDIAANASPFVLGKQLHIPVEQFACSGAIVGSTTGNANNLMEQYKEAQTYLAGSDVVVYGGANDIGWLQILTSCVQTNCATAQNRAAIASKTQLLQKNLTSLLDVVQQAHPRRLVVNTYYGLLAPSGTCFVHFGITPQEISFINDEELVLNTAISSAAAQAKATVVSVDFSGHMLCSTDSWIQNVSAKAPLHPTAAGQAQIAKQDAQVITAGSTH